ncbi:MAG: TVP38/TMEM64 family protein [Candidatus Fimenecus sp.]
MTEKQKEIVKLCLKIAVCAAVFIAVLFNYQTLTNLDVRALVQNAASPAAAGCTVLGIYILKGLVFVIPASLVYISVGMAFAPFTAVLVNLGGIFLEVIVSYLFGLFLGGEYIQRFLSRKKGGQKILEMQKNRSGAASVFVMRLLPVFPIDFVSLFLGGSQYPFWRYLLLSFLGIAPRVVLFTLLGDTIYDYIPMRLIITLILIAVPAAGVGLLIAALVRRKRRVQSQSEKEQNNA